MFIQYVFETLLDSGEIEGGYDFDQNFLKMSKGYFAFLKCTQSDPSIGVLFQLNRTLLKKEKLLKEFGVDVGLFERLATETFHEMERRVR